MTLEAAPDEFMPIKAHRSWWSGRGVSPFNVVAAITGAIIAALVLYPVWLVVRRTFWVDGALTIEPFRRILDDPGIGEVIRNTVLIAGVSTVSAVAIASLFAWLNERTNARIGWLARLLPLVPLLIPGAAGAVGWLSLLSSRAGLVNVLLRDGLGRVGIDLEDGPINIATIYGMIFLYVIVLMPIAYVIVQPAFQNLDPALEEAAVVCGAGRLRTLTTITLPAIVPALTSALFLTGVVSVALFSIPVIVGAPAGIDVVSTRVYRYLTASFPPLYGPALVLTFLVLVATILGMSGQRWLTRRGRHAMIVGKRTSTARISLGRARIAARALMIGYVLLSAALPFLGLVYLAMQPFWRSQVVLDWNLTNFDKVFAAGGQTRQAIINSAILGIVVATVAILAATVVSTYVFRSRTSASKMIDGVVKLPATMSHLILAVGILLAFSGAPFHLSNSRTILFIGFFVAYIALASFASNTAIGQISVELTEAAAVNGAPPGRTFRRVQLPLMLPSLLGGWILVFVSVVGDITVSALLAGTRSPVVGFRMLDLQANGSFPELAALGVVMTLTTFSIVAAAMLLNRGGLTSQTRT